MIALAAREKLAYSFGEALIALQIKTNININLDKKRVKIKISTYPTTPIVQ